MEIKQITFTNNGNSEKQVVFDSKENISNFLETFRLEVGEVIELEDAMYMVKNISEKEVEGKNEISVEVEFIDLIENQPTA